MGKSHEVKLSFIVVNAVKVDFLTRDQKFRRSLKICEIG